MTESEYKEKAIKFITNELKYHFESKLNDFEQSALEFVKKEQGFKYRDHVDAGVIIEILVVDGYLKFEKREKDIRYHSLTQKGLTFIENSKSNTPYY